jgi:hypothetical protein
MENKEYPEFCPAYRNFKVVIKNLQDTDKDTIKIQKGGNEIKKEIKKENAIDKKNTKNK